MAIKKDEKKMTSLTRQLRSLIGQIEALRVEISQLDALISEYRQTITTLKNLKELGAGKEVLLPVGRIAQVGAKLENVEKVVINIGSGISVELPFDEAVEQIEKEIVSGVALREALERAIVELYGRVEELSQKIREHGHAEAGEERKNGEEERKE
ncbi:prefoldin alpha subunit [Balnearium lithotrophicum]|jgi:prefoldin alpha subunit|uniref:Putative prefoldin subunit alpha n=1 Tax=Balnearium lithotrophicum TaxID=223788 RepID=A0A521AQ58_9BACT|nr:prefoldin subunit alpha [Balnearium lithotrophicum]SMO36964.1 prefoldin alpha subunit [Balnearium lithotrophicum]